MKRLLWSGALTLSLILGTWSPAAAAPVMFGTFVSDGDGLLLTFADLTLRSADVATGLAPGDPFEFAVRGTYTQMVPNLGSLPAFFKLSPLAPVVTSGSSVTYGPGAFGVGLVTGGTASVPFLLGSFSSATAVFGPGIAVLNLNETTFSLQGYDLSGLPGPGSFALLTQGDGTGVFDDEQQLTAITIGMGAAFVADDTPADVPAPGVALLTLIGGAVTALRRRA